MENISLVVTIVIIVVDVVVAVLVVVVAHFSSSRGETAFAQGFAIPTQGSPYCNPPEDQSASGRLGLEEADKGYMRGGVGSPAD